MNGLQAYQNIAVTTQSRGRLVVMLYEGAIRFLKLAMKEIDTGDFEAKGKYLSKAQDIIFELNAVLDMDGGGEIAQNLRSLYIYMSRRLSEANVSLDKEILNEVIALLEELNNSWKAIAQ